MTKFQRAEAPTEPESQPVLASHPYDGMHSSEIMRHGVQAWVGRTQDWFRACLLQCRC